VNAYTGDPRGLEFFSLVYCAIPRDDRGPIENAGGQPQAAIITNSKRAEQQRVICDIKRKGRKTKERILLC